MDSTFFSTMRSKMDVDKAGKSCGRQHLVLDLSKDSLKGLTHRCEGYVASCESHATDQQRRNDLVAINAFQRAGKEEESAVAKVDAAKRLLGRFREECHMVVKQTLEGAA